MFRKLFVLCFLLSIAASQQCNCLPFGREIGENFIPVSDPSLCAEHGTCINIEKCCCVPEDKDFETGPCVDVIMEECSKHGRCRLTETTIATTEETTVATTEATTEATTVATTEATTVATTEATTVATTEATTAETTVATTAETTVATTAETTVATTAETTVATTAETTVATTAETTVATTAEATEAPENCCCFSAGQDPETDQCQDFPISFCVKGGGICQATSGDCCCEVMGEDQPCLENYDQAVCEGSGFNCRSAGSGGVSPIGEDRCCCFPFASGPGDSCREGIPTGICEKGGGVCDIERCCCDTTNGAEQCTDNFPRVNCEASGFSCFVPPTPAPPTESPTPAPTTTLAPTTGAPTVTPPEMCCCYLAGVNPLTEPCVNTQKAICEKAGGVGCQKERCCCQFSDDSPCLMNFGRDECEASGFLCDGDAPATTTLPPATTAAPGVEVCDCIPADNSAPHPNVPVSVCNKAEGTCIQPEPEFGSVRGVIYNDFNANGSQDADEPGIGGVEVIVTASTGDEIILLTSADGLYGATVPVGRTNVAIVLATVPSGLVQTEGLQSQDVMVTTTDSPRVVGGFAAVISDECECTASDGTFVGLTLRSVCLKGAGTCAEEFSFVEGIVYNDYNANGQQDSGEPGISNVRIVITQSDGSEIEAFTDFDGFYGASVFAGNTNLRVDESTIGIASFTQTEGRVTNTVFAPKDGVAPLDIDGYANNNCPFCVGSEGTEHRDILRSICDKGNGECFQF